MRKTAMKLADGRDLFYFDDSEPYVTGQKTYRFDDPRPLPGRFEPIDGHPVTGPVMRRDPLADDWIPMASHRMNRTFLPLADVNPLEPTRPGAKYQDGKIPDTNYDVVVLENRFPSLMETPETAAVVPGPYQVDDEPLFLEAPASGRCEAVYFGSDLHTSLVKMGPGQMRAVIEAWADCTAVLSELPQIKQVFVPENRGRDIGMTLSHPHGQVYACPYLTPKTEAMLRQAKALVERIGNRRMNLIKSVREAKINAAARMIAENEYWVWHVPAAARWPIEFHLVSKQIVADFPELDEHQRAALADIYLRTLIVANHFHRDAVGEYLAVNYISAWYQASILEADGRQLLGLHNEFFSFRRAPGELKYLAGSESDMGAWISDTTPELIAARTREAAQECVELGAFRSFNGSVDWKQI